MFGPAPRSEVEAGKDASSLSASLPAGAFDVEEPTDMETDEGITVSAGPQRRGRLLVSRKGSAPTRNEQSRKSVKVRPAFPPHYKPTVKANLQPLASFYVRGRVERYVFFVLRP